MNVFELRDRLVTDYASYTRSFIKIADPLISARVDSELNAGAFWPEPMLQLNPNYLPGGTIDELIADDTLHPECGKIFRIDKSDADYTGKQLLLHMHQREAILKAKKDRRSYVLTSGTGSGKSLTYIVPIVDHILRNGSGRGVQAIVVYPMNALANSQDEELGKFLKKGYPEGQPPIRFALFTGQEKDPQKREAIRSNPPDILLTNYMMLELLLTRTEDRELVRAAQGLHFLVFDELHTYRGRQGADVALLIRRCRLAFGGHDMICIGTSATMASGGSTEAQKIAVAKVAQTVFGVPFDGTQVIGETLQRATPEIDFSDQAVIQAICTAIETGASPPESYEEFRAHPLSSWIESTFGVRTEEETRRVVRQAPRRLQGKDSAVEDLAGLTSTDPLQCLAVLRQFLLKGSELRQNESSRFPIFAFRLHQFFTRGDTVWATIEAQRHLEMSKKGSKPGDPEKLLFPLVFCRQCGTAYYRVKVEEGRKAVFPREDRREENDDGSGDAYLYVSEAAPWPRVEGSALLERVPSFMKETTTQGVERVRPDARGDLPQPVFIDAGGRLVSEGQGIAAALIRRNFLFCLEPSCGIAYTKSQRSERTKLATLGVDNRSTATTILAVRSLIELQGERDLRADARKLLSFTDNRQDASLQAGHFNDFAQVALLRSALHKATEEKGAKGVSHGELSRSVFDAMQLRFDEYAADPEVRGPARSATNDALRRVMDYHLYRDLQRGWRVTAPNLEDCGLLTFGYEGLRGEDSLLSERAVWETGFSIRTDNGEQFIETPEPLRSCPEELREELLHTLLDVLRRSLAVKVDVLDPLKQLDLVEQTKPRLLEDTVWYLEDARDLAKSVVAYPRPKRQEDRTGFFVSSYGGYGRYVKRRLAAYVLQGRQFGRAEVDQTIRYLFLALKRYGIVEQVRSGEVPGYQINADALRWLRAEGVVRPVDRTRLLAAGEVPPEVNRYFVECYRRFVNLKCVLEAREHTAQVTSEDRQEREERFRSGDLPLLFCSPTMELGVDIAQLNLVNLRNVPPTPANYAQRSGRAGRGGQPALVYTYCAGRSPHDQYYFRQPNQMVAGSVTPSRIDIRNRDLVCSHVHAVWMENLVTFREWRVKAGVGPAIINMEMGVIRRMMKKARRWHLVGADIKPLREPRSIGRALSHSEKVKLLAKAKSRPEWHNARLAAVLALNTTMRGCEIKNLRWGDVDLLSRVFSVNKSKTEAGERTIPINDAAFAAIRELRERAQLLNGTEPERFLFPACEHEHIDPMKPMKSWRSAWRQITKAAGIPGLRFHDLRHHAITELAESQASDQTIMSVAGHVSQRMLARYSHVRMEAKRQALQALSTVGERQGYDTKNDTKDGSGFAVAGQVVERNGRHEETRTPDLYRVKVAL